MKPITYLKLSLDILMVLVFALLFNTRVFSGLPFHEIAGLVLGGVFLIHLALNEKWVKQMTAKVLNSEISLKTKIRYLVDVLLLLSMIFIVVSGIMISKTILVGVLKASNNHMFQSLHIVVSYIALLLIGIHLGLSWSWVKNTTKRLFRITQERTVFGKLGIAAVALMLGFGSYTIYSQTNLSKVSVVQSTVNENQVSADRSGFQGVPPNGERDGSGYGGRRNEGRQKSGSGANVFSVLITYLGVISVFSALTVYGLKLQSKKNSGIDAA